MSTDRCALPARVQVLRQEALANVEFGALGSGRLQWTVMWLKSSLNGTPKGVIHFLDAYLRAPTRSAYEIIDFKTTAQCPATIPRPRRSRASRASPAS